MNTLALQTPEMGGNPFGVIGEFIERKIQETLDERLKVPNMTQSEEPKRNDGAQFMNVEQTAKALGISKHYLYRLMSEKKIPYYKPCGKKAYFKPSEVREYALTNRVATMAESTQAAAAYLIGKEVKG